MKHTISLLSLFLLICAGLQAGNLEKAFERLKLYDYFQAKEIFTKSMKKDPAVAAYGLSRIHYSSDNPFYNIDSARVYILKSESAYTLLDEKKKTKYSELGVTDTSISALKDSICVKALKIAEGSSSVDQLNHYLNNFSFCGSDEEIKDLRNSIAFQEAKNKNTAASYKYFLDTYPESLESNDAQNRYQERIFEEETQSHQLGAYERFISLHPQSPYKMQAERMIYNLSTSHGTIEEHKAFIRRYPENRYVRESWREIYKLSMKDYDEQTYLRFKFDFPDYPYMDELENDYKLQTSFLLPFSRNNLWGFINEEGTELISPQYDEVNYFSEGLSVVSKDGKFGYINKSGKVVIPFMWDDAEAFKNNCAVVSRDEKYGLISRSGDFLIPVEYDELTEPVEDICVVIKNGKYGYTEKSGRPVTPTEFDMAGDFKNGFAIIELDDLSGLINSKGNIVIEPKYEHLMRVSDDFLAAELNEQWGLLNMVGEVILPFKYEAIGEFHEGKALVAQNEKCGYINESAGVFIPLKYKYTENLLTTAFYQDGYVVMNVKGKNTVLDSNGVKVGFPGYENTGRPSEGLIPVQKNRKWGYADMNGKLKINCQFQSAETFSNSSAIVKAGMLYGIIDTAGQWIQQAVYDEITRVGNFFLIHQHGNFGLLSVDGKMLAPCEYDRIELIFDGIALMQREDGRAYLSLGTGKIIWDNL